MFVKINLTTAGGPSPPAVGHFSAQLAGITQSVFLFLDGCSASQPDNFTASPTVYCSL